MTQHNRYVQDLVLILAILFTMLLAFGIAGNMDFDADMIEACAKHHLAYDPATDSCKEPPNATP